MRKLVLIKMLLLSLGVFAQNADDIVRKVDENSTFDTYKAKGKVVIEGKYGKRTSEFIAYAKGADDSLIEFVSGEEEGQKIFKTADDLYIKYPYAEEIQRLSRRKTLGAVSYDEMSGERNTLKNYKAKLLGDEVFEGNDVYKIELIAKTSKVSHYKQELFVDKDTFLVWKVLYYSKSGKLTKEMVTLTVKEVGGNFIGTHLLITDRLKKNNSTESFINEVEIDIDISDDYFSLDELAW
ncbi:outer membrane lipoprotein-sorting protein [Thiospirochaeta perfilievii]|uniref:Outer membrane lipoprotein-sorting protein n=1 Tax=Thiospirochaeta perfilievii TaxID=252967 RepID=A0A5C1QEI7_9SPIO|nr:outer membrane lipoprotein-sorting protein [Thiospirochaeta perfilievii]QEN04632.1 outer membrane lipoprotein-sorting protein [Thiospirochaeta perfilievii]